MLNADRSEGAEGWLPQSNRQQHSDHAILLGLIFVCETVHQVGTQRLAYGPQIKNESRSSLSFVDVGSINLRIIHFAKIAQQGKRIFRR